MDFSDHRRVYWRTYLIISNMVQEMNWNFQDRLPSAIVLQIVLVNTVAGTFSWQTVLHINYFLVVDENQFGISPEKG